MKVRMKFTKEGEMRFIGHLDLMRHFQKALRRSNLPVKYSEGMSPHMIMSFASPLGLGLYSQGEYVDIEFTCEKGSIDEAEFVQRMNDSLVDEVRILSCRTVADGHATNAMSLVAGADYRLSFREMNTQKSLSWQEGTNTKAALAGDYLASVEDFLKQETIEVVKETKKGEKLVDIRPLIFEMRAEEDSLYMLLSAGSEANLKPELVMKAYAAFAGFVLPDYAMKTTRIDMYAREKDSGKLISLGLLGEKIVKEASAC